ncbi:MAG: DUF1080 domain-containing protein [Planctomycetes bacterium]|nr:DUF1080 domain-containing protein [Planctomycetota bacterium]
MKARTMISVVAALSFVAAANLDKGVRWVFEDAPAGKLPEGWSVAKTGKGPDSVWKVTEDASAHSGKQVLAQLAAYGPNRLFNLCVCDESNLKDVEVSVAVKAVKGKLDQGGGPLWRYKDQNNYYIARLNPLENNFRVYKVENGKRTQLATAEVEATAGKWYTIRITHKGNHIRCYLNGKLHLDVKDATFSKIGPVGLWTKADAVTSFDDFTYGDI